VYYFWLKLHVVHHAASKKSDDLERNMKMSLNVIHIFMSNRHISEMALGILMPIVVRINLVSDIAVFVLKRNVKLQPTC